MTGGTLEREHSEPGKLTYEPRVAFRADHTSEGRSTKPRKVSQTAAIICIYIMQESIGQVRDVIGVTGPDSS